MRKVLAFGGLLLLLVACSGPIDTGPGIDVISRDFSEAMRWQDFIGAGNHLSEDVRSAFLDQFQENEDMRVVDSRFIRVTLDSDVQTAKAEYRMEYYQMPSMRVKKWRWNQEWKLQEQEGLKMSIWQIVNAPPPLP